MNLSETTAEIFALSRAGVGYNYHGKEQLIRLQRSWLKAFVARLGIARGTYEIRVNRGGVAVAADVTLHTEELYVQFSETFSSPHLGLLVRSVKGRKDYGSGQNCWVRADEFAEWSIDEIACRILSMTGAHSSALGDLRNRFGQALAS